MVAVLALGSNHEAKSYRREAKSDRQEAKSFRRETKNYRREAKSYKRETKSFRREAKSYRQEPKSLRREAKSHRQETKSYKREARNYNGEPKSGRREGKSLGTAIGIKKAGATFRCTSAVYTMGCAAMLGSRVARAVGLCFGKIDLGHLLVLGAGRAK